MKTPYYNVPNLQKIADLKAEVERQKAENDSLIEQFRAIRELCYSKDTIIIDLVNALDKSDPIQISIQEVATLIKRAMEAVRR